MKPFFAFTEDDRWQLGIGDPTFMGWFTVVAYFVAAALCLRSAWLARRKTGRTIEPRRRAAFWFLFATFLFLLGVNKQLDLQTWFTLFGKHLAIQEGWYEHRQIVQVAFIGLVALAGLLLFALFCWMSRNTLSTHVPALLGGIFLGCFVLIRACSFHQIDRMLGMEFAAMKLNWILELGGIFIIGAAAFRNVLIARARSTQTQAESSERNAPDSIRPPKLGAPHGSDRAR